MNINAADCLVAAAVALLLAVVGYVYWEATSRNEAPEVVAPAEP